MALLSKQQYGALVVGIWKMEEEIGQMLDSFADPTSYLASLSAFSGEGRKREWLSVRMLLRELCGEEKQICYHPSGRPYLADHSYQISISHTQGYVAVALHDSSSVGVDIEKRGDRVCRVRRKFMQTEEDSAVPTDEASSALYLLLCWSAKEAIYKVMGREDVELKEHIRILPFHLQQEGCFYAEELRTGDRQRFTLYYRVGVEFVVVWTHIPGRSLPVF